MLTFLTFKVDEEGAMADQGIWGQVTGQLTAQVDPRDHHQLSQLWRGGAGFLLERLGEERMRGRVGAYTVTSNRLTAIKNIP